MNAEALTLVTMDYLEDQDALSGAPQLVAVPKTIQEARDSLPYEAIESFEDFFHRDNLRAAWRVLRKNDPYDYQIEVAEAIIYSCLNQLGWFFVVLITRQAGKNEISAFIQHYLLLYGWHFGVRTSGVKFAPVYKPQVQASMDRLEGADTADTGGLAGSVLTRTNWTKSDGYKYHIGTPRDTNKWAFLSINPTANIASQTAFTLLEGDEAQDIDQSKWYRDAQPMVSFANATTVLYGVAWTKDSFIYHGIQRASDMELRLEKELGYKPRLVFKMPAERVIKSGNGLYKLAYDNLVQSLGKDHISIQTQYDLLFIDTIGKYFSPEQIARMFDTNTPIRQGPRPGATYVFSLDIAGQEEEVTKVEDDPIAGNHKRDATALIIGELDREGRIEPVCMYYWVGTPDTQRRMQIKSILKHWGIIGGVCDGTGLGEPLAHWLIEEFPRAEIEAYKFKAKGDENKSKLGYAAYSAVQAGLFKLPKAQPGSPPQLIDLFDEARWQIENLVRVAKTQQTINYYVPRSAKPRRAGHVPHDDIAMACFLLIRAASLIGKSGKSTAQSFDRRKLGM